MSRECSYCFAQMLQQEVQESWQLQYREFRDIIVINNKVKRNEIVLKQKIEVHILLLHDEVGNWFGEGHGAGMLSFRSQRKLRPADRSNTASDGKLGKRHPVATPK